MLNAFVQRLNNERLGRFLLLLDRKLRGYVDLRHGLRALSISGRTFYRWKNGRVVPKESALRRHYHTASFDTQYVLTGIPHALGGKHRSFSVYQAQYRESVGPGDIAMAFVRIATESFLVCSASSPWPPSR